MTQSFCNRDQPAIPSANSANGHVVTSTSLLVGIVTRNRAKVLPIAVESAFSQQGVSFRLSVLDDGSTDGTWELRDRYPEVEWKRFEESRGLIESRNYLMRAAPEEFFVGLDDDAWFLEGDEVKLALEHLLANPLVAAVAFDILSPDRSQNAQRCSPKPAAMFVGCGHVIRLSCAKEVGFYQSTPGLYGGEEKDLCLRFLDTGYRVDQLPGVHVWHDKTPTARNIPDQHSSGVCNDLAMTLRRTPALLLPAALIYKAFRHFTFSAGCGLLKPCYQGVVLFLRHVPTILGSRRPVRTSTLHKFTRLNKSMRTISQ